MSPRQSKARFELETPLSAGLEEDIQRLAELQEGWLDGEGLVPLPGAFDSLRRILVITTTLGLPDPGLTPAPDGGIDVMWVTRSPDGQYHHHGAVIIDQDGQTIWVYNAHRHQTDELTNVPDQPDATILALFNQFHESN
jgi:hypothetical protein